MRLLPAFLWGIYDSTKGPNGMLFFMTVEEANSYIERFVPEDEQGNWKLIQLRQG